MSKKIYEERTETLERGRKLAATVLGQLERFYAAPFNLDEGKKLDNLQKAFLAWEQEAVGKVPAESLEEFSDPRLRPARKKIGSQREYLFLRNQWSIAELRALPGRLEEVKKTTNVAGGMWSGTLGI
jgi:hypothetical protein